MDTNAIKKQIRLNAEEIRQLHGRIRETVEVRDRSPSHYERWREACEEFHSRYHELAFPGGYAGAFERIRHGDPDTIEVALCFLEVRPYFFRSGYMYRALVPKLRQARLTPEQAQRFKAFLQRLDTWRQSRHRG